MADDRSHESLFAEWDRDADQPAPSFRPSRVASRSVGPDSLERSGSPTIVRDFDFGLHLDAATGPPPTSGREGPADSAHAPLPRAGDEVGGFRLTAELGRGAFARVFLAEEANLGGRQVALKVSAAEGDEPQILASLQHAHIVPVHSVRDDPMTGLRLLCMPFLGGANLAQVLEEAWSGAGPKSQGRSLIDALDQLSGRLPSHARDRLANGRRPPRRARSVDGHSIRLDPPEAPPSPSAPGGGEKDRPPNRLSSLGFGRMLERTSEPSAAAPNDPDDLLPSRRFLRGADMVRASVWVVARLAQGLDHAHSRGLLHRDIKPSNVLIAADGTPMLLDFNLSVEAPTGGEGDDASIARATLGGTLPYMAPEHLDALDPQGSTSPDAVDERSDLYSLGLILFEMIAGEPAFDPAPGPSGADALPAMRRMVAERRRPPPSLRSLVHEVPPSLDALVSKCLDPDPARRYQEAGELAEDLRRFLDDLPMKFGPEPSIVERARKWARRHPAVCSSWSTAAAASLVLLFVVAGTVDILEAMQGLHARLKLRTFQRDYQECLFLLNTFGADDDADARIQRGLSLAAGTLEAAGVDEAQDPKGVYGGPWIRRLGESERRDVRRALVDLILQDAHARVVLTRRRGTEADRRASLEQAVARLDRVQAGVEDPLSALFRQRSRYRAALGDAEGAAADRAKASSKPPVDSYDWASLGMFLTSTGDVEGAERALREAIAADVTSFWAWFALGHCHFEQGRFVDAVGDFTACVVARPGFAWGHFNRGLALARAGRPGEACDAYSRALTLDPSFTEARVNRGFARLELGRAEAAELDLRGGVAQGRREPQVLAALADALNRQGKTDDAERLFDDLLARSPRDASLRAARGIVRLRSAPDLAAKDFADVLAEEPDHALAHYGMARVLRGQDRASAIAHLDRALLAEPRMFDAVELRALERARLGDRRAVDDVEGLVRNPTAHRLYNAACALAILGESTDDEAHRARAVELLGRSLLVGFPAREAEADPDLASLRRRPDYAVVLSRSTPAR